MQLQTADQNAWPSGMHIYLPHAQHRDQGREGGNTFWLEEMDCNHLNQNPTMGHGRGTCTRADAQCQGTLIERARAKLMSRLAIRHVTCVLGATACCAYLNQDLDSRVSQFLSGFSQSFVDFRGCFPHNTPSLLHLASPPRALHMHIFPRTLRRLQWLRWDGADHVRPKGHRMQLPTADQNAWPSGMHIYLPPTPLTASTPLQCPDCGFCCAFASLWLATCEESHKL